MRLALGIVAILAVLSIVLAVPLVRHPRPPADCRERVVIVTGPDGQPLECVCIEGALSTCFSPGP